MRLICAAHGAGDSLHLHPLPLAVAMVDAKKDDPSQIGNRDVGGFNCYSIEKEIAMGKQLAGEVQRQAKTDGRPHHHRIS